MQMQNKICDKCYKEIGDKDNYFRVTTYMKGKIVKEGFMHKSCNDKINEDNMKMINSVNKIGSFLPSLFEKLGVEKKEVIEIA